MGTGFRKVSLSPGQSDYIDQAWVLKQEIREESGIFHYDREFFEDLYTDEFVYACLSPDVGDMIGFTIIRARGYMSLLAVKAEKRGNGYGQSILEDSVKHFEEIECHVRETNTRAISFYKDFGFELVDIDKHYYDNGDDGLHLKYDE